MNNNMKNNVKAIYRLTPMQEGMLYHRLVDIRDTSYHVQSAFWIKDVIDIALIKKTLALLSYRHEVLKTAFVIPKSTGIPWQVIIENREIEFQQVIRKNASNEDEVIKLIKDEDLKRGFDLQNDSLIRLIIITFSEDRHLFLFSNHHIIMDGWCMSLLYGDFLKYYMTLKEGKSIDEVKEMASLEKRKSAQYGEYLAWLKKQDKEEELNYWKQLLDGYEEIAEIKPIVKPEIVNKQMASVEIKLSRNMTQDIMQLATKNHMTVNTLAEAAWGIILQKYNFSRDVVFGKVVSGRNVPIKGIEETLGLFINTIPLRVTSDKETRIIDLLRELHNQEIQGASYEHCSLPEIQSFTTQKKDLIKTLFTFENFYMNKEDIDEKTSHLQMKTESSREQTNYPISVCFDIEDEELSVCILYNPNEYIQDEITRILEALRKVFKIVIDTPEAKVDEVEIISEKDRQVILTKFNATTTTYPREKTIMNLFEDQVKETPYNVAVVYEDKKLTYSELNAKANVLAYRLREEGIKADEFVAIMAEKNLETIVGICAILKAGGAYVPIDPNYPQDRIEYMLHDCKPKVILSCSMEITTNIPVINLKDVAVNLGQIQNIEQINKSTDLAYCIYTSGTTGKPKGSLIENRSVVRLVKNTNYIALDEASVIMQTGAMSFDASTFEVWGVLLNGGRLILAENDVITNNKKMREYIHKYSINTMWLTSGLYNQVIQTEVDVFDELKYLLIGGEKLSEEHVRRLKLHNNSLKLINGYGPTENTTFTTTYEIPSTFENISIGKPIANTNVYIMNEGALCGIGIPGELCIAGDGLSRGYLNNVKLTQEKFIENPYGEGKLYRSGDLVRWRSDGNIEYLGRIDEQVKIRGFRIEPGEIEKVIRKIDYIVDAAVVVKADVSDNKAICAYVVSNETIDINELREALKKILPQYMIPSYIMQIQAIPITRNGKVDKRALPKIEIKSTHEYIAPRNEIEEKICKIFSEVLEVEKVGVRDSFFELGGHSLRATRVMNQIEEQTGKRLPLKIIFKQDTVEGLSRLITSTEGETYMPIPTATEKEYYPMSSTQKRIYLICTMEEEGITYNVPFNFKLKGNIDVDKVRWAIGELINRHEILRTEFLMLDGELVQKIRKDVQSDFEYIEENGKPEKQLMEEFIRPFDLSKAPLLRVKIVKQEDAYFLMLDMHHIISDGMSMNIITNEFVALYNGHKLLPLTHQYKDYSEWMQSRDLSSQKAYWVNEFNDEIPILDLPLDYKRPQKQSYEGASVELSIGKSLSTKITSLAHKTETTEYMIFLSAAMVLLSKYSRQEDIIIGSPISGRTHKDTESMLGMFVNTLAMRGKPEKNKTYKHFLKEIKESCLKAYENQDYPFEELVEAIDLQRDLSRNPLFDVMLVLQNNEKVNLALKDVEEKEIESQETVSKFDLTFNISQGEEQFEVILEYCTALFARESAEQILNYFTIVLEQITQNIDIRLADIEVTTENDKKKILEVFNETHVTYQKNQTAMEAFETQVSKTPDKTAVVFNGESQTYNQLNKKINSLAYELRGLEVRPNDFVAIMADRSLEMIQGIYGVLKAGGAYVPIDTEYPDDRISYILDDCKPKIILVYELEKKEGKEQLANRLERLLGERKGQVAIVDLANPMVWEKPDSNPKKVNKTQDLAYCIYTSGTTGRPKGVMVENKGILNLRSYFINELGITEEDHVLQFANIVFDASVWEITMALLTGARCIIATNQQRTTPREFISLAEKEGVSVATLPPIFYANIDGFKPRLLITAGSETSKEIIEKCTLSSEYINAYGPTETTVAATHWKYTKGDKVSGRIPIGKPIYNMKVYILNEMKLCGIGIPGELCIAGDGLARGYLNRVDLTQEKFIDNPYGEGKLYRSGDLARWRADGNIEYLGRVDEQVKIRGYRVELTEIESVLRQIEDVNDVAVIVKENVAGDKEVYAYIVADKEVRIDEIRSTLSEKLPSYMIPSYMMQIEAIPVNQSGKVDKKALPKITVRNKNTYVAPRNAVEKVLCEAFSSILGISQVGIDDNFFEIGGDSIKAIRVASKVRQAGYELSITELMSKMNVRCIATSIVGANEIKQEQDEEETYNINSSSYKTLSYRERVKKEYSIRDIEEYLKQQKELLQESILSDKTVKIYPMTAIQKNSIEQNILSSRVVIEFNECLNLEILNKSIISLINSQALLRSVITKQDNQLVIREMPCITQLSLRVEDISEVSISKKEEIEEFIMNSMQREDVDINNHILDQVLYQIIIIKYGATDWKVYIPICHLIFDGMSAQVLKSNLLRLYHNNGTLDLITQENSYSDYAAQIKKGPVNISENDIIQRFRLEELSKSLAKYANVDKDEFTNTRIVISTGVNLDAINKEVIWNISYKLFMKVLRYNFNLESIPFGILLSQRQYEEKNYYNTIGELLDLVFLSDDNKLNIDYAYIKQLLKTMSCYNINFLSLVYGEIDNSDYSQIKEIFTSIDNNIPVLNFLGLYEVSEEKTEDLTVSENIFSSMIVDVGFIKDQVILSAFCKKGNSKALGRMLQQYLDELIKEWQKQILVNE